MHPRATQHQNLRDNILPESNMRKQEDKNTRYYIDLNLLTREVITWGFDQRDKLVDAQVLDEPFHRVFVSKGQFNKLQQRSREIKKML